MKTKFFCLGFCVLLASADTAVSQIVLSCDIDERNVAPTTMAGFQSFVISSNVSATAIQTNGTTRTFGGISVTLSNTAPLGYDDRVRTTPVNSGAFTDGELLRDFVLSREVSGTGGLDLSFAGLTPSQAYLVTIWSFDSASPGLRTSDWFANGGLGKSNYAFNGNVLPTSNNDYKFSFKVAANALGQVLIQARRKSTSTNATGAADIGVFLNAFQLELTTPDPPTAATAQASANSVFAGDNTVISAQVVGGTPPFVYQWRKDGTDIPNATNNPFLLATQAGDSGLYSVVVTNIGGSVTSSAVQVTVQAVVDIESGRISYWPLDNLVSNPPDLTTPDVTGSANHLYATNMDGSNLGQGVGGNAITFNGTDEILARIHTNSVSLPIYSFSSYSVAMWVKGNFAGQLDRRVFSESSNTNNSILVNIGTDSAGTNGAVDIFIRNNDGSGPINHRKSSRIAFDGNWHHIAWVDNNGFARLYVDGILDATDFTYTRGALTPNITSLGGILRTTAGSLFAGMIDDVALYRRSLSAEEVLSIAQCGPSVSGTAPAISQDPQSRTNNVGASPSFSVRVAGSARLVFQWLYGGDPLPGQTNSTLVLNNVAFGQAGDYSVTMSNCFGMATSAAATLTVNRLPVAGDNGFATVQDTPVTLSFVKLLANDSDADNDPISITAVSAMSTNGAAVSFTASTATYMPVGGFTGVDRFTYTLDDGRGGSATGQVEVLVVSGNLPSANQVSLEMLAGVGTRIRFAGIPGRTYQVQRALAVDGPWTTVDTRVAPLHGLIEYVDANPPPGSAFYRTAGL